MENESIKSIKKDVNNPLDSRKIINNERDVITL